MFNAAVVDNAAEATIEVGSVGDDGSKVIPGIEPEVISDDGSEAAIGIFDLRTLLIDDDKTGCRLKQYQN
jgi:hypothetical protein